MSRLINNTKPNWGFDLPNGAILGHMIIFMKLQNLRFLNYIKS